MKKGHRFEERRVLANPEPSPLFDTSALTRDPNALALDTPHGQSLSTPQSWFARLRTLIGGALRAGNNKETSSRKPQALLELSQQAGQVGSFEWELITQRILWSEEMHRIHGMARGEFDGTFAGAMRLVHPDDLQMVEQQARAVLKDGRAEFEYRIRRGDGEERFIDSLSKVVRDAAGKPIRVIGTVRDITERRHTEQALRESETRYRSLINGIQAAVIVHDGDRKIIEANPKARELLGVTPEQLMGQDAVGRIIEFLSDNGKPMRLEDLPINRVMTTRSAVRDYTLGINRPGLGVVWVLVSADPIFDSDGRIQQVIVTFMDISERKHAEQALRESEERARALLDATSEGIYIIEDGRFIETNDRGAEILAATPREIIGRRVMDFTHPDYRDVVRSHIRYGHDQPYEAIGLRKDGSPYVARIHGRDIQYRGRMARVTVIRDMTEQREAEAQMLKLSRALEQTADAVMITDRRGRIEYVNDAFVRVTGFRREEALGQNPNIIKSGKLGINFYRALWSTIMRGDVFSEVFINRKKDGSLYYEEKIITPLKDARGDITHFIASGRDISERMQTQERLEYLAHHDTLTELPNRTLFLDRMRHALARARWHKRLVAVLFIDLDRFKIINDTLGHDVGDRLLQSLGERVQTNLRDSDMVARLGGDEFAVLLDDLNSDAHVSVLAKKVLDALVPPFFFEGRELFVTASIGISLYPNDGEDASTLLKNADIAMYRAKELGKNTYQFYSHDMGAKAFEHLAMESNLRRALDRGEFRLYYQPQIDVKTGAVIGVEALVRWQHPDLGLVSPVDFVPLLEETGLIVSVGEWVLTTACAQARAWRDAGLELRMAVNVSGRQFNAPEFLTLIERVLRESHLPGDMLELEMTESVIMRHTQNTEGVLDGLNRLGVRLAVDDFGTGYSSLSYLRRFPLDTLKIDRTFVRDIPQDNDDAAIVTAVLAMAQSLKLNTVAEGVETQEQLAFLREHGCHAVQGFHFSRAVPAHDIPEVLGRGIWAERPRNQAQ